jgi:hypothetical protein
MIRNAASFGTPRSYSLIGGTSRPSWKMLVACTGRLPGTIPPTSSWWPKTWANPITRSEWKIGTVVQRSGTWPIEPADQYGSLKKKTSPGRISSTRQCSRMTSTVAEYERPVSLRPCASNRATR